MSDCTTGDIMMNSEPCTNTEESTGSSSGINGDLLLQYTPLCVSDIEKAMKVYAKLEHQVAQIWEEESSKYEETETVELQDKPSIKQRPRRNYANAEGIVTDATLFPYHNCCYPLLQAYDGLYHEDDDDDDDDEDEDDDDEEVQGQHELQPIESNAILPALFPRVAGGGSSNDNVIMSRHDASIPGFMPASVQSISAVFWNKTTRPGINHPPEGVLNKTLIELLDSYSTPPTYITNSNNNQTEGERVDQLESASCTSSLWNTPAGNRLLESGEWQSVDAVNCSPAAFPTTAEDHVEQRRSILLRLLKHAMSELSRDHGLAAVVMTQLLEQRAFDDVDCLRETLMIIASEPIACGMPCDHEHDGHDDDDNVPDHKCHDYYVAGSSLMFLVAHGMTCMTQEHATALSGFVLHLAMREFGHLFRAKDEEEEQKDETKMEIKTPTTSSAAVEKQLNIHIKRSIVANRSMNDDDGDLGLPSECNSKQVPTFLLSRIILGLGLRGAAERTRIHALLRSCTDSVVGQLRYEKLLAQSLDSYYNCLRAQVAIAETVSSTLPSTERFYNLSSAIVFSITGTLILDPPAFHSSSDRDRACYVGQWSLYHLEYQSMRVSAPFRLADNIKNSTTLMKQRMLVQPFSTTASRLDHLHQAAFMVCEGRPNDDIRNAVRMLFLRDLVDVRVSRLGYLDFLLWCRFEVDLNDPVQFWHEFNLPCEEDESDDEDVHGPNEEDNGPQTWDRDEDGQLLSKEDLEARFDFSLFALVCEWNKPWTPESHMSYQPQFRRAVQTLALSLHRLHLPGELLGSIAQFLPRDGWPDKRKRCWNYHCLAEHDIEKMLVQCKYGIAESSSLITAKTETYVVCKKCRVAFYCCRGCREEDYKAGHKKVCGRPPFCIPGKQEMRFCELIANGGVLADDTMANQEESAPKEEESTPKEAHEEKMDNDDDDGSWESIDSDDEMEENEDDTNTNHLTSQILQFFDKYNDA